jgi:hypothetical protein
MTLHFGLEFDYPVYPETPTATWQVGPKGLLKLLEIYCGLGGQYNNIEHLRIEQYRQALIAYAQLKEGDVFYQATLNTDQLAAAATLLDMRDELVRSGWNFEITKHIPQRLKTLAELETLIQDDESLQLSIGLADRYAALLQHIDYHPLPFTKVVCPYCFCIASCGRKFRFNHL